MEERPRILIAEDENIVALNLRSVLLNAGFDVVATVGSGSEAVRTALSLRPDIILMDIGLRRDMDGIDASQRIRKQSDIPIVYLTANSDRLTLDRVKATNPYGYVLKPFDERELRLTLEMALYKHRLDQDLIVSRRWLATTLKSIGDAVIATDRRGRVQFMNPVAEALTGWKQNDAAERELVEVFHIINEYTRLPVENPVEKVLRDGVTVGLANHTILIARDGRETHIDDAAAPILDEDGGVAGVVLTFRDITDKRTYQHMLERKERELNDFLEQAGAGIHCADADGVVLWANKAELDMLGYEEHEYIGRPLSEFHVDPDEAAAILARLHNGEDLRNHPVRIRRRDGSVCRALISANVFRSDGEFVYTRCFTRDITEIRQAEDIVRESEAGYRSLFENARDAIIIFSPDDETVLDINPVACELYGFTREEFLRLSLQDISRDPAHGRRRIADVLRNGTAKFETIQRRSDGRDLLLDVYATVVRYRGTQAVMSINRDITEQKMVEQALMLSEQRYRLIVENQSDFIVRWLPDGTRTYVNESYCRFFGKERDELIGHSFYPFVFPEDQEVIRGRIAALTPANNQCTGEYRCHAPDGSGILWLQWTDRAFFDEQGRLKELMSVGRDITMRKLAEDAFRKSEERYRQVVENAADFIYTTDKNGYITYVNPAAVTISGYSREELIGRRYLDFIPAEERHKLALLYVRQFVERRQTMYVEFPFITGSGTVEWFGQTSTLMTENNEVVGFHVIGHSVSEHRRSEQQLLHSRNQIHAILEASPFPLVLSRLGDQHIVYLNKRAADTFGIPQQQEEETYAPDLYVDPADRRHMLETVNRDGYIRDYEARLKNGNNGVFWGLISAQLLEYEGEKALLVAVNDITARKQAEEEVRRLNATLEERVAQRTQQLITLNQEKDDILAIVAHDLKNPLTGILMSGELLHRHHDTIAPELLLKQTTLILESAARMEQIIANLLNSHQLDSGTISLTMNSLRIGDIVPPLLHQYRQRAAVKNIRIDSLLHDDLQLYADRDAVSRIIDNLLSNAVKFSPHGSTVRCMAVAAENCVRLTIQDEGPGFQQEDMEKLFTKFARLSARPTGGEHSSGLGLSIVKRLTDAMNGKVWCNSAPGSGATFIVEFPIEQQAQ